LDSFDVVRVHLLAALGAVWAACVRLIPVCQDGAAAGFDEMFKTEREPATIADSSQRPAPAPRTPSMFERPSGFFTPVSPVTTPQAVPSPSVRAARQGMGRSMLGLGSIRAVPNAWLSQTQEGHSDESVLASDGDVRPEPAIAPLSHANAVPAYNIRSEGSVDVLPVAPVLISMMLQTPQSTVSHMTSFVLLYYLLGVYDVSFKQ